MRSAITCILFVALLMPLFSARAAEPRAVEKNQPNIVILFADDLGYGDLNSYGNPYIRTPSLDSLADEGQRWTDFYVGAPVCSPSRGTLLTGQLSVRSGLYGEKLHVMFPNDSHGIPRQTLTLATALKSVGYRTGMFGKWHLGDAPENFPTRYGFDYWYGIPYSNDMNLEGKIDYDMTVKFLASDRRDESLARKVLGHLKKGVKLFDNPKSEYWQVPLYRSENRDGTYQDKLLERPLEQTTFTRRLTEEAIRFIEKSKDQPFLVYLPYSMPHLPVFASDTFAGKSLRGAYGDAVEEIDWSVGRLRETLEQLGLAENTLVFFSSDNGPWQTVSTFRAGSAGMLRGSKGTTWEGGMRVPGVFWWPGKIKPGVVSDIGTTMDIFSTTLQLAGVAPPDGSDGYDLTDALLNAAPGPRDEMPYYHKGHLKAYRKGNYKVVFYGGERTTEELKSPLLYDLHQDISEQKNIAGERPDVLRELMQAVARHRKQTPIAEPIFDMRLKDL